MPNIQSVPLFEHPSVEGDHVVVRTMAAANGTLTSREFKFEDFFHRSQGIFKLSWTLEGGAGDTIAVKAQFYDGDRLSWATNELTIKAATDVSGTETGYSERIDILNDFRNYVPFDSVRFVFTKAGDETGTCTIKARLVIF